MSNENTPVELELDAQELEDMEAPGWAETISVITSFIGGVSVSVALT